MLFESGQESVYNEGLIVDSAEESYAPKTPPQNMMNDRAMRQAALGMVRTDKGFEMRAGNQSIPSVPDPFSGEGEMYTGDTGLSTGRGDWEPISSADIGNLRSLGINV